MNLVNELKDYTQYHFKHEEEYMESIGYKGCFPRKLPTKIYTENNEYTPDVIDEIRKRLFWNYWIF